jgi:hypothetical protein
MTLPRMADGILYQDSVLQLLATGDLFVERWSARGDPARMRTLLEQHGAFVRRRAPAKTLFLVHIASGEVQLPEKEIRELIQEHTRAIDPHTQATALVMPTEGMMASIFRSLFSAALLARRSKFPYRVFAHPHEALDWLATQRADRAPDLRDGLALRAWYADIERHLATA